MARDGTQYRREAKALKALVALVNLWAIGFPISYFIDYSLPQQTSSGSTRIVNQKRATVSEPAQIHLSAACHAVSKHEDAIRNPVGPNVKV